MKRKGITLIETVIGLTIIGTAFYLLITVFISLTPRTARIETLNKKAYLAQEKMEEYLARDFSALVSVPAGALAGDFGNYNYQITVTNVATADLNTAVAPLTNLKHVKVGVWGGPVDSLGTVEIVSLVSTYETQ